MPVKHHRRSGHHPGHVRDTAVAAFQAWIDWPRGDPEPTVEHEVNYQPRTISLSGACRLVWNCTDILPGTLFGALKDENLPLRRQTYAAAARAILDDIKQSAA